MLCYLLATEKRCRATSVISPFEEPSDSQPSPGSLSKEAPGARKHEAWPAALVPRGSNTLLTLKPAFCEPKTFLPWLPFLRIDSCLARQVARILSTAVLCLCAGCSKPGLTALAKAGNTMRAGCRPSCSSLFCFQDLATFFPSELDSRRTRDATPTPGLPGAFLWACWNETPISRSAKQEHGAAGARRLWHEASDL